MKFENVIYNKSLWYLLELMDFNWNEVCGYYLPEEFVDKFWSKLSNLNLLILIKNNRFSERFLEKFVDDKKLVVKLICQYQNLSEEFIRKYWDKLDKKYVCKYQNLSEEFLEEYWGDCVKCIDCVLEGQILSEEFLEKYWCDCVKYVKYVAKYQVLSEKFIRKYWENFKCCVDVVVENQFLSDEFIDEYITVDEKVLECQKVSEGLLEKYVKGVVKEEFGVEFLSEEFLKKYEVEWCRVLYVRRLPEKFLYDMCEVVGVNNILKFQRVSEKLLEALVEKFKDVDWSAVVEQKLSGEFIDKYFEKFDVGELIRYQMLPVEVLAKFKKYWKWIAVYQELPEWFIEKFENKLCWESVSRYQKLSEEFIRKFKDKLKFEKLCANKWVETDTLKIVYGLEV